MEKMNTCTNAAHGYDLLDLSVADRFMHRLHISKSGLGSKPSFDAKLQRIISAVLDGDASAFCDTYIAAARIRETNGNFSCKKLRRSVTAEMKADAIVSYRPHVKYIKRYYDKMTGTVEYPVIRSCRAVIIEIMAHALSAHDRPPVIDDNVMLVLEDSIIDRSFAKHVHDTIVREGLLSYYDRVRLGITVDTAVSADKPKGA